MNYNIVMLACHYGSIRILEYLYEKVISKSSDPKSVAKYLLKTSQDTESGIQAVHLACFLGKLDILKILFEKFNADFNEPTSKGLTGLHCAAQSREGIVSIYFLKHNYKGFDPNIMDSFGATPLHYAIMSIEENNI